MNHSLIIYDGDCAFCTWCVLFVIRRNNAEIYRFTPMLSHTAVTFFNQKAITDTEMIWLVDDTQYFYKSSAVLRIIGRLGGIYKLSYLGFLAPRFIRDWVYDNVAQRRKHLVQGNVCPVIPTKYQHLFIE